MDELGDGVRHQSTDLATDCHGETEEEEKQKREKNRKRTARKSSAKKNSAM